MSETPSRIAFSYQRVSNRKQAGADVQTGEMQNALVQTCAADPGIQPPVQPGEAPSRGWNCDLMQDLLHAHRSLAFFPYFELCSTV